MSGLRGIGAIRPRREHIDVYLHVLSLVIAALVLLRAMHGQWFYYDEWEFLAGDHLWNVLSTHNGHFSLLPATIASTLYGLVGLHAYWPYLAVTVIIHLAIAHMLWRVMRRVGVQRFVAVALALLFALLGSGADDILWGFQTGFILPILFGLIAFEIVISEGAMTRAKTIGVAILLLLAVASAGTALPIVFALFVLILVRKGWRPAVMVGVVVGVPYLVWYVLFNLGPNAGDAFRAASLSDLVAGVPEFLANGLLGAVSKTIPVAEFAPAVLVVFGGWIIFDIARQRAASLSAAYYLVMAAVVFGLLTAVTRVQLGNDEASAGRYVYFYVAMLLPAFGLFLTALVKRSVVATSIVCLVVLAITLSNSVALIAQSDSEAQRERFTREAMSAVVQLGTISELDPSSRPILALAPQLSAGDIERFVADGAFSPVAFSPEASFSVELTLGLSTEVVAHDAPASCAPLASDGYAHFGEGERLLYSPVEQYGTVFAERDGIGAEYVVVPLHSGMNRISGFDSLDLAVSPTYADGVCSIPAQAP